VDSQHGKITLTKTLADFEPQRYEVKKSTIISEEKMKEEVHNKL
jgi:hypothetical protein